MAGHVSDPGVDKEEGSSEDADVRPDTVDDHSNWGHIEEKVDWSLHHGGQDLVMDLSSRLSGLGEDDGSVVAGVDHVSNHACDTNIDPGCVLLLEIISSKSKTVPVVSLGDPQVSSEEKSSKETSDEDESTRHPVSLLVSGFAWGQVFIFLLDEELSNLLLSSLIDLILQARDSLNERGTITNRGLPS